LARKPLPELRKRLCVEREDLTGRLAGENEIWRGKDSAQHWKRRLGFAHGLAGRHVDGCHAACL
jgi:hypothetical protein